MNAVNCLYDMIERPGYIEQFKVEVKRVVKEDRSWMQWKKSSSAKLKRFSFRCTVSCSKAISWPTEQSVNAIQNEPEDTPEPEIFDIDRHFKLRQKEGEGHHHQFSTTSETILNFGHGAYSYPGRFFIRTTNVHGVVSRTAFHSIAGVPRR